MKYDNATRKYVALNDSDREEWINSDEGLYRWWRRSRTGITTFIRANRAELDEHILAALNRPPAR